MAYIISIGSLIDNDRLYAVPANSPGVGIAGMDEQLLIDDF